MQEEGCPRSARSAAEEDWGYLLRARGAELLSCFSNTGGGRCGGSPPQGGWRKTPKAAADREVLLPHSALAVAVGAALAVAVAAVLGAAVAVVLSAAVGAVLGAAVGAVLGAAVGAVLGAALAVVLGAAVAVALAAAVAAVLAAAVAVALGAAVAVVLGAAVAAVLGAAVAVALGAALAVVLGAAVAAVLAAAVAAVRCCCCCCSWCCPCRRKKTSGVEPMARPRERPSWVWVVSLWWQRTARQTRTIIPGTGKSAILEVPQAPTARNVLQSCGWQGWRGRGSGLARF